MIYAGGSRVSVECGVDVDVCRCSLLLWLKLWASIRSGLTTVFIATAYTTTLDLLRSVLFDLVRVRLWNGGRLVYDKESVIRYGRSVSRIHLIVVVARISRHCVKFQPSQAHCGVFQMSTQGR